MKVGIVSKFHAADGLCVRANGVLKGLVERGHDVHVFTQSKRVEGIPPENIHRYRAVQLNPHFSIDAVDAVKGIVKDCNQLKIEALHVQMNSGSTEFILPYFKNSLPPLVVTFHLAYAAGASLYTMLFGVAWRASAFAAKKYDEIILVDPSQLAYMENYGITRNRMTVIRNWVHTDLFTPAEEKREKEVVDFVYVGRLSYDKGVNILLEAFRVYHKENKKSRLTLIGDGMLKHQIQEYNSNGSIRWLGTVPHSELPNILQRMDVFVIPQNIGGLGLGVMEAMGCGLPVITTGIGETIRLLNEDEGILVEPNSVKEVTDAMKQLGGNRELRTEMGRRCREKIVRKYSWENQMLSIENVYERAAASRML